ncbi:hypothetical protein GCM10020254_27480 [Streptomyces goshikiensis]
MGTALAAAADAAGLDFSPAQKLLVVGVCALTAGAAHMALAVFNDGVRPFMLDFIHGRATRNATGAVSFGLSAGFVFGLGAPMALSTGVLNPWLLFLPTDVLGILAPRRWLAPLLGAAWGAVVVYGLGGANELAHGLPVDFLTAMRQMSTPILFLFALFPALAVTKQFGRLRGALTGAVTLGLVVLTMRVWPGVFAGAPAMAVGVLMLIGFAVAADVRTARASGTVAAEGAGGVGMGPGAEDPMASLFSSGAARLRRHLPLFMALGAGVCALAQMKVFGGGRGDQLPHREGPVRRGRAGRLLPGVRLPPADRDDRPWPPARTGSRASPSCTRSGTCCRTPSWRPPSAPSSSPSKSSRCPPSAGRWVGCRASATVRSTCARPSGTRWGSPSSSAR